MNDRPPLGIGEDAKGAEIAGSVREGPRQAHGQEPRIATEVSIRVATHLDSEKLRGMFSRTSSETIYRRFRLPYPEVPEWMIALMFGADHHKESLVAPSWKRSSWATPCT